MKQIEGFEGGNCAADSNNEMKGFSHPDFGSVRVIEKDGEPWFVAKDVCDALGLDTSNLRKVLDDDELMAVHYTVIGDIAKRGNPEVSIINESGLYSLILRSRKPEAKKFKKWVTGEVLPSIRKNGFFGSPDQLIKGLLGSPDLAIQAFTKIKEQQEQIEKLEDTQNRLMHSNKTYSATDLSKEFGYRSAQTFNIALKKRKIQFKMGGVWKLYAQYAEKGYTETKQGISDGGGVYYQMRWTQKGRLFLSELLGHKSVAQIEHELPALSV